ncbi:hypothetical protein ISG07_04815 [Burkholderia pseudomallei]|nr:hypothetical protein [Burkholderia pseudomallei]
MMTREQIVERHIQLCWSFVRTALVKRVVHEVLPQTRIDFWRIIQGGTLDLAVIEWCKLFGNRDEDTHWTQLIPETDHNKFRSDLRAAVGMNEAGWDKYWHSMMAYRNEVAAHHDLDPGTSHYPSFDVALEAVYHYYNTYLFSEWAIKPQTKYPPDMREYAKGYQEELRKVAAVATDATKSLEPGRAG